MLNKLDNPLESCGLKFDSNKKGEFVGYASKYNGVDTYRDTILPGAFKETIAEKKTIPMFVNHDSYQIPVGRYISLKEDDAGLLVKGQIDLNHAQGPSLHSAMLNETMDALSIGFRIRKGGAYEDEENQVRVITNIDLKEISVVNFPADDKARISLVKSDLLKMQSLKDIESFLRESGYSKSAATAFVSRVRDIIRCDTELSLKDEIAEHDRKRQIAGNTDSLSGLIQSLNF